MSTKPPEQTDPGETPAINGADAVVNAMGAAMTNRDAVLKSLAESQDQVFRLLEAQRDEALKPMLRAKELLRQARASAGAADVPGSPPLPRQPTKSSAQKSAEAHQRLCRRLSNTLTVFLALQGAGGAAADAAREQAVSGISDALAELVEAEVDKLLRC